MFDFVKLLDEFHEILIDRFIEVELDRIESNARIQSIIVDG